MTITPELVLKAYAYGVFPMAKSREDTEVFWVQPKLRGVIPLDQFHVSRSLRKTLRRGVFRVTANADFAGVLEGCAESAEGRIDTWINNHIMDLFIQLHEAGLAHSIETWLDDEDGTPHLAGGLYGLAMGAAFFGESMFSRATDASKVALTHLAAILKKGGFTLLDTQFITDHLKTFGAIEIPQKDYLIQLSAALARRGDFGAPVSQPELEALLLSQRSTQIS
ncbi:MAG: leucyl/phenylalanyl-tRNA--protein transferase [Rhodospirillaceae bacterium]|nr:leucyl/phenylalanyl-tRNA--protein transferase [Rhodospirillaceae bacterium]